MTETTADDIRQMAPDALRQWLAERLAPLLGCRVVATSEGMLGYPGIYYYHDDAVNPSWTPVPDWPHSLSAAWSLVLEHCAQGIGGDTVPTAHIEIWTRPDGSVLVFDAWWYTSSSLRKMDDHKVSSYPGLSGPVALADALARLAALALLERG